MKIIGLDLAGKSENPTGFCLITFNEKTETKTKVFYSNKEILEEIDKINPDLIAIDAPFEFPEEGYFRKSDILLKQKGFKPLSPRFPGMRYLVNRVKKLIKKFRTKNYKTIEVFPKASEKILGLEKNENANEHEYDALLCALTGKYYKEGEYENLDGIIIPKN